MNLKIGVAVLAAVAVALSVAAAPASATVLCKIASTSSCGAANDYGPGTKIESHLKTGTRLIIDGAFGEALYECRESALNLLTTSTGSLGTAVVADTETFSFGTCEGTTPVVVKKPGLEIIWTSGGNNGTIRESGIEITVVYLSQDCVYGAPEPQTIGPLTGGKPAEIWLNLTLARIKGIGCPEEMTWKAIYEVTTPNPLYVTTS